MRAVFGAVLVASGLLAAQPALAREGAAPATLASLPVMADGSALAGTLGRDLPAALTRELTRDLTQNLAAGLTTPAADALRLPVVTLLAPGPRAADGEASFRRRFTGSMVDFYPLAGSGFHLSGGARLYSRRNFLKETEDSARGVLSVTRSIGAPMATRPGFRRFNPALTAGYTMALSAAARLGIEGGAMMGHLFASAPGLPRGTSGYRSDNAVRANPVANLVFGYKF